ncbi:MAG: helix-turn-helix domain-containing protein [Bacilli bacterium]|nr:helix-turn-helix domain-containing protein [Bacilli bacterium]
MEFKDKLRNLRTEAGLSQEALADLVHISRSAIAKYENGNGKPSEDTLKALALYFGVDIKDLRDEKDIKKERISFAFTIVLISILVTTLILFFIPMYFVPLRNVVNWHSNNCYYNESTGETICYPTSHVEYGFRSIANLHYYGLIYAAIPLVSLSIVLGILSLFRFKIKRYLFISFLITTAIALIFAVLSFVLDCRVDFEVMAV